MITESSTQGFTTEKLTTQCCIVGGGPAGLMLGWLLARQGIFVMVLEKHADFLRDFRGDTIHPSTLQLFHELGLLQEFLRLPHQEVSEMRVNYQGTVLEMVDFSHLPSECKFIVLMPQWHFLNFIASQAQQLPNFKLLMLTEAQDLLRSGNKVIGVQAQSSAGAIQIHADLVVTADGRHSLLRAKSGLKVRDFGAPIDVLWMRLPRHTLDPDELGGYFGYGKGLVLLMRGDYWQCAFIIPKGGFEQLQQRGLAALQADLVELEPFLHDRVQALQSWNDVKLLTVTVDRLRRWYLDGLLCIGDAAHAMSPIGGVGINLALQDAVASANVLIPAFQAGQVRTKHLAQIQRRRILPTWLTQKLQLSLQERIFVPMLKAKAESQGLEVEDADTQLPLVFRLFKRFPWLRRIPARIIGVGFRPEHIKN